jgi:GxxExxY protein
MTMPEKNSSEYKHSELTSRIIRCAFKVHSTLGPGFPENVYQKALFRELTLAGLPSQVEKIFRVSYEGAICGEFRVDLYVDENVTVELKALDELNDNHLSQCLSYLKASGNDLVLLMNFGQRSLKIKRVIC